MRPLLVGACLGLLALSSGCGPFNNTKGGTVTDAAPRWNGTPKPEQLVAVLNQNAQAVQSLEAKDAFIKAKMDRDEFGLGAYLACQKPARAGTGPNFRLQAQMLGADEVDIGSNSDEFWFWIKRSAPQPVVYHCAYSDYKNVAARGAMPFPIQPQWVAEALGMVDYDPKASYTVRESQKTYELIEQTTSAKGDVVKVVAFHKTPVAGKSPVAMYVLHEYDASKKQYQTICSAVITDSQVVPIGGGRSAVLPKEVRLSCPREKLEMTMDLGKIVANVPFDQDRTSYLFTRRTLNNYKSYDLARGPDAPASGVRPAGGIQR